MATQSGRKQKRIHIVAAGNKITGSIFTGVWLGLTFHLLIEKLIRKNFSEGRYYE